MAQRKQPSAPAKKAAAKKAGARPTGTGRPPTSSRSGSVGRPPTRKPGKSIVNQRQTPWTLIAIVAVLVLFAGGIVAYAVTRHKSSPQNPYTQPEVAAAKQIKGIIYHQEPQHTHVPNQSDTNPIVKYDMSPPIGGNHSQYWADNCGTVYNHQLANENAVHMLEHGAVWITYNPKTATASDIATLKADVQGVAYLALTPYQGLKTPVSLQSWGYQLFVQKASDPRVEQFIGALRHNKNTTPEFGVTCSDPSWSAKAASESQPGHPYNGG